MKIRAYLFIIAILTVIIFTALEEYGDPCWEFDRRCLGSDHIGIQHACGLADLVFPRTTRTQQQCERLLQALDEVSAPLELEPIPAEERDRYCSPFKAKCP